jgi:hypothetical protein
MNIKNSWSWKIFLLCPFLIFYNRYLGCWIFFAPAITWGILLILIRIRFMEWLFIYFLVIINALYLYLFRLVSGVTSHFIGENVLDSSIILIIIVALYFLICNIWLSIISEKYLPPSKLPRQIFLTRISHYKWDKVELLMIIPSAFLVIIINYTNFLAISMGMQAMP